MSEKRRHLRVMSGRRDPVLASDGGGPHDPGMEARLVRLESDVTAIRADLGATRAICEYIRGRLESLPKPGKWLVLSWPATSRWLACFWRRQSCSAIRSYVLFLVFLGADCWELLSPG